MMINPTKKQKSIHRLFYEKVTPWLEVDDENHFLKLKNNTPDDVKRIYDLFQKEGWSYGKRRLFCDCI